MDLLFWEDWSCRFVLDLLLEKMFLADTFTGTSSGLLDCVPHLAPQTFLFLNPWTAKIWEQSSPIFHLIFICPWQKFWWHCMVLPWVNPWFVPSILWDSSMDSSSDVHCSPYCHRPSVVLMGIRHLQSWGRIVFFPSKFDCWVLNWLHISGK